MTLTQNDFDQIEELTEKVVEEKIKFLPTKDELYGKLDSIVGELKTIREEIVLISHKSSDHEERINELELIHPAGKHAVL